MTSTVLAAAAILLAVWVAGRVLTVLRQYLAGRRDNLEIVDVVVYQDESLVTFAANPTIRLTAHTWWVANEPSFRHRLERWREEGTWLRAYLSTDGGIMLADPRWGGNVACEPAMALS